MKMRGLLVVAALTVGASGVSFGALRLGAPFADGAEQVRRVWRETDGLARLSFTFRSPVVTTFEVAVNGQWAGSVAVPPSSSTNGITVPFDASFRKALSRPVPDVSGGYPEATMFKHILPAYGLYVDQTDNLTLKNVTFRLFEGETDLRPPIAYAKNVLSGEATSCTVERAEPLPCRAKFFENCVGLGEVKRMGPVQVSGLQ